jgi:hypothetical protein
MMELCRRHVSEAPSLAGVAQRPSAPAAACCPCSTPSPRRTIVQKRLMAARGAQPRRSRHGSKHTAIRGGQSRGAVRVEGPHAEGRQLLLLLQGDAGICFRRLHERNLRCCIPSFAAWRSHNMLWPPAAHAFLPRPQGGSSAEPHLHGLQWYWYLTCAHRTPDGARCNVSVEEPREAASMLCKYGLWAPGATALAP